MRRATVLRVDGDAVFGISIHALHEESDVVDGLVTGHVQISIHALHEESDMVTWHFGTETAYFNPRSP